MRIKARDPVMNCVGVSPCIGIENRHDFKDFRPRTVSDNSNFPSSNLNCESRY